MTMGAAVFSAEAVIDLVSRIHAAVGAARTGKNQEDIKGRIDAQNAALRAQWIECGLSAEEADANIAWTIAATADVVAAAWARK